MGWIDDFITSSPSRALRAMTTLAKDGALFSHVCATLWETVVGFVLGTVLGTIAAALLWWFPRAAKVLDPYLVVLNALPKIALGPIIIVWVGAGHEAPSSSWRFSSRLIVTILERLHVAFRRPVPEGSISLMRTFGATRATDLPHGRPSRRTSPQSSIRPEDQRGHVVGRRHHGRISGLQGRVWAI